MKKLICKLVLFSIIISQLVFPAGVDAIRLGLVSFEWQSLTAGVEMSSAGLGGGWGSINTATTSAIHGGIASFQNKPTTSASSWIGHIFRADASTSRAYARCYVYVVTLPSANGVELCGFWDSVAVNRRATVLLTSGGVGQLLTDNNSQIGSDSSSLSLNTWYCVQISATGANAGTEILEASIEADTCSSSPTAFASTSSTTIADFNAVYVGSPNANATYDIYWDDIAVNDTATTKASTEISYPGEGKTVALLPNGDGDTLCTSGAGDWANIAEVPPSDTATAGGSNICEADFSGTRPLFNMTDSSTAGIDSYDTIKYISPRARVRPETAAATNYILGWISASAANATGTEVSVTIGNVTTVGTNPDNNGVSFFNDGVGTTTDPTTGVAWTPTGTNSIDNMQMLIYSSDANPDLWITTAMMLVEYVDGSPPAGGSTIKQSIFWDE